MYSAPKNSKSFSATTEHKSKFKIQKKFERTNCTRKNINTLYFTSWPLQTLGRSHPDQIEN